MATVSWIPKTVSKEIVDALEITLARTEKVALTRPASH
jgi:hypothetical protein